MLCCSYALYDLVEYFPGYYIAYLRCVIGFWEVPNDMRRKYGRILNLIYVHNFLFVNVYIKIVFYLKKILNYIKL